MGLLRGPGSLRFKWALSKALFPNLTKTYVSNAYSGQGTSRSGSVNKYVRVSAERNEFLLIVKAFLWLHNDQLYGREATPEMIKELKTIEKLLQRMADEWDETKYYRRRLDSLGQRIAIIANHYGMLAALQNYVDSLKGH